MLQREPQHNDKYAAYHEPKRQRAAKICVRRIHDPIVNDVLPSLAADHRTHENMKDTRRPDIRSAVFPKVFHHSL